MIMTMTAKGMNMANKRLTANDYCKELHKLKLDQIALEKRIRARATELIEKNPYVVIVENHMGSEGNLLAKNLQDLSHISIERVLDFITIIEADLASKHPHKQTKIDFSSVQVVPEMPVGESVRLYKNIPYKR